MKKAFLLLVIGLCLVGVALAADFSGTWVLNAEKSDQGRGGGGGGRAGGGGGGRGMGGEMVITQTATEFSITRGQNETKYVLDGAEHTLTTQRGETKYKAVLSGDTLALTGTQSFGGNEMPLNTKYTLSADGKELTVTTVMNMGGQETTRKQVYDKK